MINLKETYWAWLAGLIEGEGAITIAVRDRATLSALQPMITIEMTDCDLVRELYKTHGGTFGTRKRSKEWKRSAVWRISSRAYCYEMALKIRPYTRGNKQKQLDAFIEHLEIHQKIDGTATNEQLIGLWETANNVRKHALGKPGKKWTARYKAVRKQQCKNAKISKDTLLKDLQPATKEKAAKRAEKSIIVK